MRYDLHVVRHDVVLCEKLTGEDLSRYLNTRTRNHQEMRQRM